MHEETDTIRRLVLLAGVVLLLVAPEAHARLYVSIDDAAILPGGTAEVDVWVRSDAGDLLDNFGLEIQITTTGSTQLEFVSVPPLGDATDPHLGTAAYLFHGDSGAELFPPAGIIDTTSYSNDTYRGGDGTMSWLGIPVPATDTLLTTLEVTAATSAPPDVGDEFTISLVPSSGFGSWFNDPLFAPIEYESDSGTVTIIPEPGTLSIFLVLAGLGGAAWIIRRRRSA